MPIELTYDSAESAPEEIRSHLKKDEATGKFKASAVPAAKLDEFRDNNIRIRQENEKLVGFRDKLAPLVGEDLEGFIGSYKELQGLKSKIDNKELVENSSFEEALSKRTEEMKRENKHQIETLTQKANTTEAALNELRARHNSLLVDRHVTNAVTDPANGALPEALSDILNHARSVFRVNDKGEIVPVDGDGNKLYGADGSSALTPKEWLAKLRSEKPYFFKNSSGGGAAGSGVDARTVNGIDIERMTQSEYEAARKAGKIR